MSNQNSTSGGHVSLETALQTCEAEVRKAIARAEAVDPASDEYGHAADNAYMRAMKFLKMTAKLGMALAKLKGASIAELENPRHYNIRWLKFLEEAEGVLGAARSLWGIPAKAERENVRALRAGS